MIRLKLAALKKKGLVPIESGGVFKERLHNKHFQDQTVKHVNNYILLFQHRA